MSDETNKTPNVDAGKLALRTVFNVKSKVTADLLAEAVINGDTQPAYIGVMMKKLAKIAEHLKKNKVVNSIIEEDTLRYQEGTVKTFDVFGARVTAANRGFWDFSTTEDPLLEKLKEIETTIKEQIKFREDELKLKSEAWEKKNSPLNVVEFGVRPYNVTWDELPKLTWIEGAGEVETNPPTKKGGVQLRYSV